MFERFVSLIEKIAIALETIAKAPAVCAGLQPQGGVNVPLPPAVFQAPQTPANPFAQFPPTATTPDANKQAGVPATTGFLAPANPAPAPTPGNSNAAALFGAVEQALQSAPTRNDAGKALVDLANSKGREIAVQALAQFGATDMDTLAPTNYANFINLCKKAQAA